MVLKSSTGGPYSSRILGERENREQPNSRVTRPVLVINGGNLFLKVPFLGHFSNKAVDFLLKSITKYSFTTISSFIRYYLSDYKAGSSLAYRIRGNRTPLLIRTPF